MRLCRNSWLTCLILIFAIYSNNVSASAVPAYTGKLNQAVGGLIQFKIGKWGFAANDPRIPATLSAVGTAATTIAVGVGTGAIATVGWPALLVSAGITALVSGAVSLSQDALYKWFFNADSTISSEGSQSTSTTNLPLADGVTYTPAPLISGSTAYCSSDGKICSGNPMTTLLAVYGTVGVAGNVDTNSTRYKWGSCTNKTTFVTCATLMSTYSASKGWSDYFQNGSPGVNIVQNYAGVACTSNSYSKGSTCTALNLPTIDTPGSNVINATPSAAVANVPDTELSKPVSDQMLAASANAIWKQMASSNGLPWSASDPITPADVAAWKAVNPGATPTVSDFLAPVASPSTSTVPITQPGTSTQTGPGTTTSTGTQSVDFGPNPNIGTPLLEPTPTAQSIMSPILNLMPDLKNFAVPSHQSVCPTGSFYWNSRTFVIDAQCSLIDNNRTLIEGFMLLVWSLTAVFIVLRA